MNGLVLLGIIFVIYALFILVMVIKKPASVWKMKKVQTFIKVLGEKGTDIVFLIFSFIVGGLGIWLILANR